MTTKPPFKWHLAQTPSRTYCNQILRTRTAHFNPNFFLQEPKARRCVPCEAAYERTAAPLRNEP